MSKRNEPCPCGSGRKRKKCCGAPSAVPAPPYACYLLACGPPDMSQQELQEHTRQGWLLLVVDQDGRPLQFEKYDLAVCYARRMYPGCPYLVKGVRADRLVDGRVDMSQTLRI